MKLREDVQTSPIEINVQSTGVAKEDRIFHTTDDVESEDQYWARKPAARRKPPNTEPTNTIHTITTNLNTEKPEKQFRLRKTNRIVVEHSKDAQSFLKQLKA